MQFYQKREQKNVAYWNFFLSLCVLIMAALGAATRLTGSGLSMVEWNPFIGAIPPLNENSWFDLFQKYKETAEFIKVNTYFSLQDFKSIFWLEYLHRLWGRLIGLFFLLPFFYFLWKKKLSKKESIILFLLFSLGLFQGAVGWFMVKSGLTDQPWVSPFLLAFHLTLAAFLILAFFVTGLHFLHLIPLPKIWKNIYPYSLLKTSLCFLFITFFFGALVAGNKAGLIYNTFPKMDNTWIPDDLWKQTVWWENFFYNPSMIQFMHRLLAIFTILFAFWTSLLAWKIDKLTMVWCGCLLLQSFFGILTLLFHVPIFLATLHQAWAFTSLLFGVFLYYRWHR